MLGLAIDRFGNLTTVPAFLAVVQPRERAWWRICLVVLAAAAAGAGLVIGMTAGGALDAIRTGDLATSSLSGLVGDIAQAGLGDDIRFLAQVGLGFGLAALLFVAVLARINGRPMRTWITAAPHLRWRLFAAGVAVFSGICLILGAILWLGDPDAFSFPVFDARQPLGDRLWYLAFLVVFIVPQAALEEILDRGWLMQATSAFTRNLVPIILINTATFAALHATPGVTINLVYLSTGISLSWAALRLGGLEFAIGCHAANNILIGIFQGPINDEETGSPTWFDLGQEVLIAALTILAVEIIVRNARLRRLLRVDLETAPAPA